jgi:hypothetical protein
MDSNITMEKTHAVCTYLLNENELLLLIVNRSSKSTLKFRELPWYPNPRSHIFINYIAPFPIAAPAIPKMGDLLIPRSAVV